MMCTYSTFIGAIKCALIEASLGVLIVGGLIGAVVLIAYFEGRKK